MPSFKVIPDREPWAIEDYAVQEAVRTLFQGSVMTQEYVAGQILYASAPDTLESLDAGEPGDLMQIDADGFPDWARILTGDYIFEGDLIFNGTLQIDSWNEGSLGYTDALSVLTELPIGTAGQVLGVSGAIPAWQTPSTYLAHDLLSPTHTDTIPTPVLDGDIIYGVPGFPAMWGALPIGGIGAPLVVNPGGVAPQWVPGAPFVPGAILHHNILGTETLFTTNVTLDDTSRILSFLGGAASIVPATTLDVAIGGDLVTQHGAGVFSAGRAGRRVWQVQQPDGTGRMGTELWPDDFTITTATGSGSAFFTDPSRVITTSIPGGAPFGNDTAVSGMNFSHTMRFTDIGFAFASQLLINAAVKVECAANIGPLYLFLDQYRTYADGGARVCSQHNAMRAQPAWGPNINGGSMTQTSAELFLAVATVDGTVGTTTVSTLNYFAAKTPSLVAGGVITTLNVLDIENITGPGTIRGINSAMNNGTFINHTGTAPSILNGQLRIPRDTTGITMGLSDDFQTGWAAANYQFFQANTVASSVQMRLTPEARRWTFGGASSMGMRFNVNAVSFGTTSADPTTANWFTIFAAPNQRQPSVPGEYSDVLWTAGGSIDINGLAMSSVQAFKINSPAVILNGGTISDLSNLFVEAMPSFGATRHQALRVLGRSRLDGLMCHNQATLATLTANVAALALPPNNAGRFVLLQDADALGPWAIQGIVNVQVGDAVYIVNNGANAFTINHQDGAAAAADRIISPTGANLTLGPDEMAKLWYDPVATRWRILEHTGA